MKFNSVTPNLLVESVDETIKYYSDKLGFTVMRTVPPTSPLDWAMVKREDVIVMFQTKKSITSELTRLTGSLGTPNMTLYIKLDGIGELYEMVRDEVEMIADLEETFYGTREFSIMDLNGFVLTFAEETQEN